MTTYATALAGWTVCFTAGLLVAVAANQLGPWWAAWAAGMAVLTVATRVWEGLFAEPEPDQ